MPSICPTQEPFLHNFPALTVLSSATTSSPPMPMRSKGINVIKSKKNQVFLGHTHTHAKMWYYDVHRPHTSLNSPKIRSFTIWQSPSIQRHHEISSIMALSAGRDSDIASQCDLAGPATSNKLSARMDLDIWAAQIPPMQIWVNETYVILCTITVLP